MSTAFAHASHWLVNVAYVAPLILLAGVVAWGKLTERRGGRAGTRPTQDELQ